MSTSNELFTLQQELNKKAEEVGKLFGFTLDYSNSSIQDVEKILEKIHEEYIATKNFDGLRGVALEFASYIITTIEKNFTSGEWKRNGPEFGEETFPYYFNNQVIFPLNWCLKRISDGSSENVWDKYSALVLK